MYNQQAVSNRPTAAYYVTLIGSILGIIAGIVLILIIVGIWIIIASALTLYFARKLMDEPMRHSKWGTLIIVFGVLSPLNIITIVGGVLALAYSPTQTQAYSPPSYTYQQPPYQQPQQQTTRYCSHCGAAVNQTDTFCPHCGAPL